MSTPEYTDADQQRDMDRGSDGPGPGARDMLNQIFTAGARDETATAPATQARSAARKCRPDAGKTSGADEKGAA